MTTNGCTHRWLLAPPAGGRCTGECRLCGESYDKPEADLDIWVRTDNLAARGEVIPASLKRASRDRAASSPVNTVLW